MKDVKERGNGDWGRLGKGNFNWSVKYHYKFIGCLSPINIHRQQTGHSAEKPSSWLGQRSSLGSDSGGRVREKDVFSPPLKAGREPTEVHFKEMHPLARFKEKEREPQAGDFPRSPN